MKVRVSLSLISTLFILLVVFFFMFAQIYINNDYMNRYSSYNIQEKVAFLTKMIDVKFENYFKENILFQSTNSTNQTEYIIVDRQNLSENLSKDIRELLSTNESKNVLDIISLNIILPDNNDELKIFASYDNRSIGNKTDNNNLCLYVMRKDSIFYDTGVDSQKALLISPIHFKSNGWTIGAYEMIVDLEDDLLIREKLFISLLLASIFLTSAVVILLAIFVRKILIKPLGTLVEKTRLIGKGKLETQVDIESRDEIGELGNAFNEMAKNLKESRDKIHEYNRILENLLKQKDEFIGQLGHDLKNPLQPLVGLLPMLIEQEKNPDTKEALEVMNKNALYMQELIFKTLQLAKLRSENIKFDFEDINLYEEVTNVIESEKILLRDNNFIVENKISKDIVVWVDKLRLVEVFKNLISNALKYKSDDNGKITIDAQIDDNLAIVSVSDNGIGITKEQLKRVFDEFYKADRFSSEERSSGLGLSICKRIVEKHGGEIRVDSEGLGKGTTFYFKLKLSKGSSP